MGLTYINKKAWQTPLPSFLDLKNYLLLIHKRQALIEPDIHLVGTTMIPGIVRNQGEFLVYSTDGAIQGIDTITVMGGRFEYEPLCEHEGTIVITMPNGQEVPVFVKPGKAYSVSGDAQNLKMVKVEGGDENKLMNEFREQVAQASADTVPAEAIAKLVESNPTSAVGLYLVTRHIIQRKGDYAAARRLLDKMLAADSENTRVRVLQNQATEMELVMKGKRRRYADRILCRVSVPPPPV